MLNDPSYAASATYGVALQDFYRIGNWPTTFVVDRQGTIRFIERSSHGVDRPSADRLIEIVEGLLRG